MAVGSGLQVERWGYLEFGKSGLGGWVWLGSRPRELPAECRIVRVALPESVVETKLARLSHGCLRGPPPLGGGSFMGS